MAGHGRERELEELGLCGEEEGASSSFYRRREAVDGGGCKGEGRADYGDSGAEKEEYGADLVHQLDGLGRRAHASAAARLGGGGDGLRHGDGLPWLARQRRRRQKDHGRRCNAASGGVRMTHSGGAHREEKGERLGWPARLGRQPKKEKGMGQKKGGSSKVLLGMATGRGGGGLGWNDPAPTPEPYTRPHP
uniref:DUF834 domain-containing protein n=1 Tax=Oryza rufipogon TaxID=4529 RepID=A0A0E0P975_ORYRU